MNAKSHKTVFSKRLGTLVAVGEHVSGQGKANGASSCVSGAPKGSACFVGVLTASFVMVGMAWAQPAANALPTGGQVALGAATISQSGAVLNIDQSTAKAVLNWQTFDIGKNATVNIHQPNAAAVMLNRVSGANPSQIFGQLNANGQVVLINPNGVLFGKDGSVNANSFTASTLGLSDANFMAGKYRFEAGGASGSVVNQGAIKANGGYVALIGASVANEGRIETKGGNVFLAAGSSVTVPVSPTGRIKLELSPAAINAAVANSQTGTIVTEGGNVFMQASALNTALASIIQSGNINASGTQGGAVHLLADGGSIKVDGRIAANSEGAKGGDIVIGRDVETGVLANRANVSGAVLESRGGFVETSGDWLATNGVVVKAKDWLLDPTDINIVATGTATPDTPSTNATGTTTYQETSGISTSEVLKSTIESAINNGTNVTITTANPTVGANGAGNITISTALSFANTGATDATLTLQAKNGITQNTGASITTDSATSTKLVHVVMSAEGAYMGNAAASASSQGITLNSTITTNGNVTMSGTNNNTGSGAGVRFANGSGISAASYIVNGAKLGTAGNGYGVWFSGTSNFASNGSSVINGVSNSATGAFTAGLMFDDSTTVTLDAGAGSVVAKGSNSAFQTGVRIAASGNNSTSVTTKGTVTLGSNDATSQGFMLRSGVVTADSGALTILGKTNSGSHGVSVYDNTARIASNNGASITLNGSASTNSSNGVNISSATINAGTGDLSITGSATNFNGVYTDGATNLSGRNITIDGTATTTSSGYGVRLVRNGTTTINASNNLSITGTVTGSGTGNGVNTSGSNVGSGILMTAGGTAAIKGIQTGNASNTANALYLSGFRVSATGDVTIQAEAANSNSIAINMNREAGSLNGVTDGRMQVASSSGTVLIQSNQGAVVGADWNGGVKISGVNVILDNTGAGMTINGVANANGGGINTSTGAITLGSGTSTYSTTVGNAWAGTWVPLGVSLGGQNSTNSITATGNLTIGGSSSVASGVAVGGAVSVTGNVNLAGRSGAASTNGLNIAQALNASGNINLSGESTQATPGVGLNIGAEVKTTGAGSTTTLTSTTGAVSGSGKITTAAGNTGSITVNTATAGELAGVISGDGSLVKQGVGTTTLTGNNSYTGTTTISAGALQVGNGGATGTLGSGAVVDNSALVFNRSGTLTVSGSVSGTGTVTQAGSGTTILAADNFYIGTTNISAGTLQVGNGGTTGTLGSGDVTLAGGSNLNFNRSAATTINNDISGNGNVSATITGALDVAKTVNLTTAGNTVNLSASGNITQSAGSVTATNLYLTATGGSIGTSANRINSDVSNLSMISAGSQFVSQTSALNLAAKTTGTGNIDVKTTNGTLKVTSVNGVNGVTTTGNSGGITLEGNAASGHGMNVSNVVTAIGDVSLTGKTSTTANGSAGIFSSAAVSGRDITIVAGATGASGQVLGYYGGGGTVNASQQLNVTGDSINATGVYSYTGSFSSGAGMSLTGTSVSGSGVGFDNNFTVTNTGTGGINITGTASASSNAISMGGVAISNSGGDVRIKAITGNVTSSVGDPANWGGANRTNSVVNSGTGKVHVTAGNDSASNTGAINGTVLAITQNANADVVVSSSGTGNVMSPKVTNNGTGNVVIAAGTQISAGNGAGGQVQTVTGNTISQANATPGATYVYTGAANSTGALSNLGVFGSDIYLSTIGGNTKNAASNTAYATIGTPNSISGGANAQVMFREKVAIGGALNDAALTYGSSTGSTNLKSALQTANSSSGTTAELTQASNAGSFKVLKADLVADSTSTMNSAQTNTANLSSSSNLKARSAGYAMDVVGNNYDLTGVTAQLVVGQRNLVVTASASSKVYDGTSAASVSLGSDKVTGDLLNLASTSSSFSSPEVGANKVVTIDGISVSGIDSGNYLLSSAAVTTTAAITAKPTTASNLNALQPVINPAAPAGQRRVVVDRSVNAAPITVAAANVLLDTEPSASLSKAPREEIIRRNECSILNPENCECEQTAIPAIEVCYVPVAGRVKVLGNQN